ncbi:GAF domain-containing protein [Sphingomonas sp.]|uniref:GAF domain-containing protein n=1 Tax=Sphingomonas sp. TaxID=28214 RepID=UPI003340CA47
MNDLDASVAALRHDAAIKAMLVRICETTAMGFAAVVRVTDSRWVACQVLDRIEFGLDAGDELDLKTTICDEIRGHGRSVIIDHVAADRDWPTHPTPVLYGFQSYIAFPIVRADGSFFGTLCAIDPQPHKLDTPEIVGLFQSLSREIAALLG